MKNVIPSRRHWGPNMGRAMEEFRTRTGREAVGMSRMEFRKQMDTLCGTPDQGGNAPERAAANWLKALGIEPPNPECR